MATHFLVHRLAKEGKVDGLLLDHVDGLYDPAKYLQWLQDALPVGRANGAQHFYVVVKKILAHDESLPPDWPIAEPFGLELRKLDQSKLPTDHRCDRQYLVTLRR